MYRTVRKCKEYLGVNRINQMLAMFPDILVHDSRDVLLHIAVVTLEPPPKTKSPDYISECIFVPIS